MAALAGLIKQSRSAKGWTQQQLVEAVPIGQSTISRYEKGEGRIPDDETIRLIAEALDADPVEFLRVAERLNGETFENVVMDQLAELRKYLKRVDATTQALLTAGPAQRK
jgi:transcriptional regulator with XRE-family HTH domain